MKNLFNKLLLVAVVGSFVLLYSCGEDDTEEPTADAPSISFTVEGGTLNSTQDTVFVQAGGSITWDFTVTAPGGFNTFRITGITPTFERTRTDLGLDAGATSASIEDVVTDAGDAVGNVSITVTAVDDLNQTSDATVVISVTSPDAKVQSAVMIFAPTQDENSKTFYSIGLDSLYSVNDVEAIAGASPTVDLGYFYVTEANLASPSDYSTAFTGAYDLSDWTTRNATSMVATTLTDVVEITTVADVEAAIDGLDFTAGSTTVEGLTVGGTIYAFQTAGGLQGLFRVTALEPGFDQGDNITLEFILAASE